MPVIQLPQVGRTYVDVIFAIAPMSVKILYFEVCFKTAGRVRVQVRRVPPPTAAAGTPPCGGMPPASRGVQHSVRRVGRRRGLREPPGKGERDTVGLAGMGSGRGREHGGDGGVVVLTVIMRTTTVSDF